MRKNKGFTIIEALLASVLIGIGISALIAANTAMSKVNIEGTQLATAEYLLEQIREMTETTSYNHLYNLNGKEYSPAVDADGEELTDFDMYSQHITVANVAANDFDNVVAAGSSDFLKITVQVNRNDQPATSTSWIRARY